MKYPFKVNHNGVYYEAGQEIPDGVGGEGQPAETFFSDSDIMLETLPERLSREYLELLTVKEIKKEAEGRGFSISKTLKSDVINEFLEKQQRKGGNRNG